MASGQRRTGVASWFIIAVSFLPGRSMSTINASPLPDSALLARYQRDGAYADCYASDLGFAATHAQFVTAFYTTWLFKLERLILKWTLSRPSSDAQAAELAAGLIDEFAAWRVEARAPDQLLLTDIHGRTRSWLMVTLLESGGGTRLYFGSAVVPRPHPRSGKPALGFGFRALLGFHRLYSVALLSAARAQLRAAR